MRGPVETVSSDPVFAIERVRDRVQIRTLGQRLMKGCIEYRNLRYAGKDLHKRPDALQVGGIVKGRHRRYGLYLSQHTGIDGDRASKALSTVHHAVTGGLDSRKKRSLVERRNQFPESRSVCPVIQVPTALEQPLARRRLHDRRLER